MGNSWRSSPVALQPQFIIASSKSWDVSLRVRHWYVGLHSSWSRSIIVSLRRRTSVMASPISRDRISILIYARRRRELPLKLLVVRLLCTIKLTIGWLGVVMLLLHKLVLSLPWSCCVLGRWYLCTLLSGHIHIGVVLTESHATSHIRHLPVVLSV